MLNDWLKRLMKKARNNSEIMGLSYVLKLVVVLELYLFCSRPVMFTVVYRKLSLL